MRMREYSMRVWFNVFHQNYQMKAIKLKLKPAVENFCLPSDGNESNYTNTVEVLMTL